MWLLLSTLCSKLMLARRYQLWLVCVAWWISWRFDIALGTHTLFVLVVQSVRISYFVALSDWSIRFACVPVSGESIFYCVLDHGFVWGMAHAARV